ncbi:hypothetical protein TNCV_3759681 [Trichonephila clavipes]|nr:hypothetical protein TNCV_3759681 [Trichonephila clavipes]
MIPNTVSTQSALSYFREIKKALNLTSKENDRSIRETGHLGVQPGRGRKSTRSDVVEDVVTAIVDPSMDNIIGCSSARTVS